MRWYDVFVKGIKEQIRDYWILVLIVVMAPLFIAIYYLIAETEEPEYDVILVNRDRGTLYHGEPFNLGDSIVSYARLLSAVQEMSMLHFMAGNNREEAIEKLRSKRADVLVLLPEDLSVSVVGPYGTSRVPARLELVGDVTQMEYIVGAIWSEELNKVLIRGLTVKETLPEMAAIVALTLLYFVSGTWAFRRRHMRAR